MAWVAKAHEPGQLSRADVPDPYTPAGFKKVRLSLSIDGDYRELDAWFNGKLIVVPEQAAMPITDKDGEEDVSHNCDQMGCGWEHVVMRASIEETD